MSKEYLHGWQPQASGKKALWRVSDEAQHAKEAVQASGQESLRTALYSAKRSRDETERRPRVGVCFEDATGFWEHVSAANTL